MDAHLCTIKIVLGAPAGGWYYGHVLVDCFPVAIFSMSAKFCSRSAGKGAVAQAAYRAGEKFVDELRGRSFDYSKKTAQHDIHHAILAPEGAPSWVFESEKLWNKVQDFETALILKRFAANHKNPLKREKSRLAREKALHSAQDSWTQIIALPRELTEAQNIEMLERYLQDRFVARGLIVDYAIHKDTGNWHAHVAVPLRELLPTGTFCEKKITSYKGEEAYKNIFNRPGLLETRYFLAEVMNHTFEKVGLGCRVDARTLEEQGIKRAATRHEGYYAQQLDREGKNARLCLENQTIKERNLELYLKNPAYLLNDLARQFVVFTDAEIAKEIHKLVEGDADRFYDLFAKVKAVALPEVAKIPHEGGFQYTSEELIAYFETQENARVSFEKTGPFERGFSSGRFFEKRGLSRKLLKEGGQDRADLLAAFIETPGRLGEYLAQEKIVFRVQDVENTLLGLVVGCEKSYRLLEAYGDGRPLEKMPEAANQSVRFEEETVQADVSYWVQLLTQDVLKDAGIVALGENVSGERVYTSQRQQEREQTTLNRVERLAANQTAFSLKESRVQKVLARLEAQEQEKLSQKAPGAIFTYSAEQKDAMAHLLSPGQLKVLKGRAGTGKSTVLKPVVASLQDQGYDVKGMAFQGKVSDAMAAELGIPARTIDSYRVSWQEFDHAKGVLRSGRPLDPQTLQKHRHTLAMKGPDQLTAKSVVVIDEGSLVGLEHYDLILSKVEAAGAKLLIVKDDAQIKTLFGADIAEALDRYVPAKSLLSIQRQKLGWMRDASAAFNDHRLEEGFCAYEDHGHITYAPSLKDAKKAFIEDYLKDLTPQNSSLGLTFLNKDVRDLNHGIYTALKAQGKLGEEFEIQGTRLAVGAVVIFNANDKSEWHVQTLEDAGSKRRGVNNGTFGVIEAYDPATQEVRVRLRDDQRLVAFNSLQMRQKGRAYTNLSLGYVISSTRSQGETVDRVKVLLTPFETANSALVTMTRHRDRVDVYVSKEQARDFRDLAAQIGGSAYRGTTLDYSITEDQKPFHALVAGYRSLTLDLIHTFEKLRALKEFREEPDYGSTRAALNRQVSQLKEHRATLAGQILDNWGSCATFVKQAGLREEKLALESGKTQGRLTTLERHCFERVEAYIETTQEARGLWKTMTQDRPAALVKGHPLYAEYQEIKTYRNAIAAQIALAPHSYERLFRVHPIYEEDDKPKAFTLLNGTRYDTRPPSFKTCLTHAQEHEKPVLTFEGSELGLLRQELYDTLKAYQDAKGQAGQAYYALKEQKKGSPFKDQLVTLLEGATRDRETHALKAVGLLEKLSFTEAQDILDFLKMSPAGHARLLKDARQEERRISLEMVSSKDFVKQEVPNQSLSRRPALPGLSKAEWDALCSRVCKEAALNHMGLRSYLRSTYGFERVEKVDQVLRYGKKGSFVLNIGGAKAGLYYSHERGEGGSLIQLCQREMGWGFQETLQYLARSASRRDQEILEQLFSKEKGTVSLDLRQALPIEEVQETQQALRDEQATLDQKKTEIQALLQRSRPLSGTAGEIYLRHERGLQGPFPEDLRYLPAQTTFTYGGKDRRIPEGALVSLARREDGEVTALQLTYLTQEGKRARTKAGEKLAKITYGVPKGSFVRLQDGLASEPLYIAEGVETALSLKEAGVKGSLYCSLGTANLRNLSTSSKDIIIAADWDGSFEAPSWQSTLKGKTLLEEKGHHVTVLLPCAAPATENRKIDFNDVLREKGISAVQELLQEQGFKDEIKTLKLTPEKPALNPLLREEELGSQIARLDEQVPGGIKAPLSPRESKSEGLNAPEKDLHIVEDQAVNLGSSLPAALSQESALVLQEKKDAALEALNQSPSNQKSTTEEISFEEIMKYMKEKTKASQALYGKRESVTEKVIRQLEENAQKNTTTLNESAASKKSTTEEISFEEIMKYMKEKAEASRIARENRSPEEKTSLEKIMEGFNSRVKISQETQAKDKIEGSAKDIEERKGFIRSIEESGRGR